MTDRESYAFGDFALDVTERRLSKGGRFLQLTPKLHDVLVTLVRRAGHLVTKRELLAEVWPESFVEEGILTVHVSGLRKASAMASRVADSLKRCWDPVIDSSPT